MAKAPAKFKSDFLLLDVKAGRKALAKQMARGESSALSIAGLAELVSITLFIAMVAVWAAIGAGA